MILKSILCFAVLLASECGGGSPPGRPPRSASPTPSAPPQVVSLTVTATPGTNRVPSVIVRPEGEPAPVLSWAEHGEWTVIAEGRADWSVRVSEGDRLDIDLEGERAVYRHNGRTLFTSAAKLERGRLYEVLLTIPEGEGKASVFRQTLRLREKGGRVEQSF